MAQRPIDAEATEALLKLASKTVDDQLGREQKYPELSDFFNTDFSAIYVAPDSRQQILRRKRAISLPDTLFEQYNLLECRCFMGLFPEIGRVWITIDHRLFLWNYADGNYESYEELDQIIVNVALVKPKPDTFDDKVEYLLVIATPIEVHLLGMAVGAGASPHTLYITNMSVPTDNVAIRSIVGTADGRIYMNGNDGRLWEIDYQAEEGWFSKKCSKREVIGSALSYFIPTFLSKIRVDPITKIVSDESRQVMYGLTENSNIEVIDLAGAAHARSTIKASYILQEGKRKSNHNRTMDENLFKIVDIHIIPSAESKDINLLALTATGCRLYFGHRAALDYNNQRHIDQSNSGLYLLHVRIPPTFESAPEAVMGAQGQYRIHQALYNNGMFLAAHSLNDAADVLIATAPDSGPINQASTASKTIGNSYIPKLTELAMIAGMDGKIWGMSEVPGVNHAGAIDPSISRNELAVQLSRSAREYLVLTNSGVQVFVKRRPIDTLQQLLLDGRGAESDLVSFFTQYGRVESCAMCIAILCGHPSLSSAATGSQYMSSQSTAGPSSATAERLLLEWGGRRSPSERLTNERVATTNLAGSELGRPVSQSCSGQYTYRHTALSLYLARTLRPIWKRKVIKTANTARGLVDSEISDLVLTAVQKDLFSLRSVLNANIELFTPSAVVISNPPGENDQIEIENANAESKSLKAQLLLITQSIEGIAFVLFLIDSKMSETVSNIPLESQQVLLSITYETLLTTSKGHDLCRELVTAVINKQMGHHMSVDAVSDTLQRICGSFCSPGDVIFYKATEHLRQSLSSKDPADIEDHARESLRLFKKVPFLLVDETHGRNKLQSICKDYMDLKFFPGAVELALSCAQDVDPSNKAAGYVKDGMNSKDNRAEQYAQRVICYENAVAVLKELGLDSALGPLSSFAFHTLETALQFDDSLFHTYLYDWLLSHGRADYLLEISSPYIEEYLKQCTMLESTRDLLWRYYIKSNDFGRAAQELGRIADSARYQLTFEMRLEYLSLAVSNAKSYPAGSDPKTDSGRLLIELEEKLEVGNIQLDIILSLKSMLEEQNRTTENPALDNMTRLEARHRAQDLETLFQNCKAQLLDINILYHTYVEPLHMYESMLAIYHASDVDDEYHVRAAWEGFIAKVFLEAVENGRSPLTDVEVRVKDLGRRFYPSAKVTPIATMVQVLERYPYLRPTAGYRASPGWAVRILREIGFPYEALFESFHALIETKKSEWIGPRASLMLIQDIEFLLRAWLAESHGSGILSELNDALGISEDEWLMYGGGRSGVSGAAAATLGLTGTGSLDRFRARKIEDAIQMYIRILESASWTPAPVSGAFDDNLGGSAQELAVKAGKLVQRLQVIRERLQRLY
ncbi:Non-repetitive/WGA-negative nucleoporin C-terminal-domain-containing protein [Gamsiella multidivaricata]|uniref:Non-repetitive/WGA-negative nucleoporin C-terminal-domain-containing protein n=1 Tax=Gamsiella multidivaricata TaxID=101098 RepID=UPI002220FB70|nr:Non-repetitive/WGA-negative nucleoporin C-terminal-domain-containing protein [Gamsiella multidivaricata]KAI7830540.1 Non-repetitive/WGA-negative nucleoporin C-terminal-domain-containing protein [Gamsiella multidivaricata]